MITPTIYDPSQDDSLGALRGGGRIVSILKENLAKDARFISDLNKVSQDDTLLIPLWRPFQKPLLTKRLAKRHILLLFDAIPLKYPQHFPIGLKGRWRLIQNLQSLNIYDQIITISEHSRKDIAEYMTVDIDKIQVVYPTTSMKYFKPVKKPLSKAQLLKKYHLPSDKFCLYVGDTNWNKNLFTLAQALISADRICVFVGKTFSIIEDVRNMDAEDQHEFFARSEMINHPEQRAFKEFMKLAIYDEKHFVCPGYIEDEDLVVLHRHAVCNVLVSRDEGFGLSYLEAATQKNPSILADRDIFHEVAGKAALFADPRDHTDIAKALVTMFDKPKTRTQYAKAAFKQAQKYSPSIFRKKMLAALSSEE